MFCLVCLDTYLVGTDEYLTRVGMKRLRNGVTLGREESMVHYSPYSRRHEAIAVGAGLDSEKEHGS